MGPRPSSAATAQPSHSVGSAKQATAPSGTPRAPTSTARAAGESPQTTTVRGSLSEQGSTHAAVPHSELTFVVDRVRQGDEQSFRHLYRTVQPRLLNYARAMVGDADAEDVTAEAWLCIVRDVGRFEGDGQGFVAWAATITRHRATDHLRKRRPVTTLANEDLPERGSLHDVSAQAEETLSTAAALALIKGLPVNQAQVILLRVVIGLDTATTARVLGKQPGAVRTAAHRGLRTLGQRLDAPRPRERRTLSEA